MVASWDLQMTNIVMMTDTDRPRLEHPPSTLKTRSGRSARNVAPCVSGSDIVDKFIAVSVGGGVGALTLKDNRARENERENIRKKLAMEAEKMEKTDSSCDLQLCFRNEMASSDDDLSENVKEDEIDAAAAKAAEEEIVRCNISHKAGQIIVPIVTSPLTNHEAGLTCPPIGVQTPPIGVQTPPIGVPTPGVETNPTVSSRGDLRSSLAVSQFQAEVTNLQQRAREGLLRAREQAKVSIQDRINTRQKTNEKLFQLLGLPEFSKLNRRTLSRLNVAQLQLIQNDYLSQIQGLNEELVNLLVSKDGLVMEQDAMLTDIEDLSEFINLKK